MVETTTDYEELLIQAQNAANHKFDYKIRDYYAEITYPIIDSGLLMRILSGLILVGFRHIRISAGFIQAYFDEQTMLVIYW